tara:strand:- start:403 stop:579 length:177 start_codon:yes stop_codon:yes gene_type:complete
MENSLDNLFGNPKKALDGLVKEAKIITEKYTCEMCSKSMTEKDHHYCDICGDCLEGEA